MAELDRIAAHLKLLPDVRVTIEGHTDSRGADEYNQALSERRAEAAARYLEAQGVDAERLDVVGRGESTPVAANETPDGRAKNRRVILTIQYE